MKQIKHIILVLLVGVLIWLPITKVNADTAVCKTEKAQFETLDQAVESLRDTTGTITLLSDIETDRICTIRGNVTFDLAGHKIQYTRNEKTGILFYIHDGGSFCLTDSIGNGVINCEKTDYPIYNSGGTVIIQGGTINVLSASSNAGVTKGIYNGAGKLVINGGTIMAGCPFKAYNPSDELAEPNEVIINDGNFIGEIGCMLEENVKCTINGGYFSGKTRALYEDVASGLRICSGHKENDINPEVTISGGEFIGKDGGISIINYVPSRIEKIDSLDEFNNTYMSKDTRVYRTDGSATVTKFFTRELDSESLGYNISYSGCEIPYHSYTMNHVVVSKIRSNVLFNANGGSVNTVTKVVTYEDSYGELPSPTREGHTFLGWFTEPTGGTQITDTTVVAIKANQTLYAHWQSNTQPAAATTATTSNKVTTKITVSRITLTSLTSKQGKVIVKYSAKKKITGYQIAVCTSKKFKKGVKYYITSKTNKTIKGLKKGKTFYVRVRAFKVNSAKRRVYGAWSKVKKVKVRK